MRIAVDIDGVLLDSIVLFCKIFNEEHNTNYRKSNVGKWEFFYDWGLSEEQAYSIFHKIYENSLNVPIIDKWAPNYLMVLNKYCDVNILSARNPFYINYTVKKLSSIGIKKYIQYREIYLINYKSHDIKLNYNYDIYIDDNPLLVESIKDLKNRYLLLFDQPWNQNCLCEKNVMRVKNWKEILKTIESLNS